MKTIIHPKDLYKITEKLNDVLIDYPKNIDMEIVMYSDEASIQKLNEELYYTYHQNGNPEKTNEVIINMNNYKFIYKTKN